MIVNALKKLLGLGPSVDLASVYRDGALIVDVRTPGEFSSGHIEGSMNIPLDQLKQNLGRLKSKDQVIITCCASGMRSAAAKNVLKSNGYLAVHNGGGWSSLSSKIA